MAVKAFFPTGVTSITLGALHQWDYGQMLEIETSDPLPSIVEVHFSCVGMNEAEVCECSVDNNIATVAIPDLCLEQSAHITAWIYEIVGSEGRTTKSITIPMIARARPAKPSGMPDGVKDLYAQAIGNINEAIASLADGGIVTKEALHAETATHSNTATEATHAKTADQAHTHIAAWAKAIERYNQGDSIVGIGSIAMEALPCGLYHVTVESIQDNLKTGALIFYYMGFSSCVGLLRYPTTSASGGEFFLGINCGGEQTNRLEVFKTTTQTNANGYLVSTTNKISRPSLSIELVARIE